MTVPDIYDRIRGISSKKEFKWHYVLKRNQELAVLRKIFRKNFIKSDEHIRLVSEWLVSKELFPLIENTVVHRRINEISATFVTRSLQYKLRNLQPKRKIENFKYCFTKREQIEKLISEILRLFKMHNFIGDGNMDVFQNWVLKKALEESIPHIPQLKDKEIEFIGAFKAKAVLRNLDPVEKNFFRGKLLKNVLHGLFWWTLAAMRECVIPIQAEKTTELLWRRSYLEFLKIARMDFKERYDVKRIKLREFNGSLGNFKIRIVHKKLRPIFREKYGDPKKKLEQLTRNQQLLSRLRFLMKSKGMQILTIKESCQKIRRFLDLHKSETVHVFTADITKCFSTVNHDILINLLKALGSGMEAQKICSVFLAGTNIKNRFRKFCLSEFGEEKMRRKLDEHSVNFIKSREFGMKVAKVSNDLETVCKQVGNYFYKRGKRLWRVKHGVPQGHPLSSLFSNLYLFSFEEVYWKELIEKAGDKLVFSRYEDDYIFCTTDKMIVEEMLKPLNKGGNSYNLETNKDKGQYSQEVIEWCGVTINVKEVTFLKKLRLANKRLVKVPMQL